MPTRKQRRRNQKARRHEYEYVYVDDEGNEVEVDEAELQAAKNGRREAKPQRAGNRSARTSTRTVQPPSWRRALRRAAIFGPLLVVTIMLLNRHLSLNQQVAQAVLLLVFFVPFSYFTDSLTYRVYRKRVDRQESAKGR
jgi:hypothetical protein